MITGTLTNSEGTFDIFETGSVPAFWVAVPQGADRKARRRFIRKAKKAAVRGMRAHNQGVTS